MATRSSGYEPIPHERFYTPAWVTGCLLSAFDFAGRASGANGASAPRRPHREIPVRYLDPCAGAGHICAALESCGIPREKISGSDIAPDPDPVWPGDIVRADARDFSRRRIPRYRIVAVTNPPYGYQMRTAIDILELLLGRFDAVGMLLPALFDCRRSRRPLFERSDYAAEISLTTRIRWENLEQKKSGPSGEHSWHVWDQAHRGAPLKSWRSRLEGEAFLSAGRASGANGASAPRRSEGDDCDGAPVARMGDFAAQRRPAGKQ